MLVTLVLVCAPRLGAFVPCSDTVLASDNPDVNHFASCLGEVPSCKWGQSPPKPCVMDALGLEQQHSELFTQSV